MRPVRACGADVEPGNVIDAGQFTVTHCAPEGAEGGKPSRHCTRELGQLYARCPRPKVTPPTQGGPH